MGNIASGRAAAGEAGGNQQADDHFHGCSLLRRYAARSADITLAILAPPPLGRQEIRPLFPVGTVLHVQAELRNQATPCIAACCSETAADEG